MSQGDQRKDALLQEKTLTEAAQEVPNYGHEGNVKMSAETWKMARA